MKLTTKTGLSFISSSAIFFLFGSVFMYFAVRVILAEDLSSRLYQMQNNFIENQELGSEVELDPISMSKIYRVAFEDNSIKEIHYDDAFTLSKKYDYAMNNNLQGVGIWALGYDNGNDELWNLIEDYFSTDIAIFNDPITEVNGFPIRFAESLIKQKDVFIAIIVYFVFALVTSFVFVLSDWRIRDSIMKKPINQLIIIFIGFVLLTPLVVFVREILDKSGFPVKSNLDIYRVPIN